MKLLLLMPLVVVACITTQLKTDKATHSYPKQERAIMEAEPINPFNPFFLIH